MALSFPDKLLKWGYDHSNGPDSWHQWFPVAREGVRQSPINIVTSDTRSDQDMASLAPRYKLAKLANVENTSKSFQVNFFDNNFSSLTGGPLAGEYQVKVKSTLDIFMCKISLYYVVVVVVVVTPQIMY